MATYAYDDYRVTFVPRADGGYDVHAVDVDGTVSTGTFDSPLSADDLAGAARGALAHARGTDVTRDVGLADDPAPVVNAEQVGAALATALLAGSVGDGYDAARAAASSRGRGLRMSLSLAGSPPLLSVPWEFMYRRPRFLASQRKTPIVRLLDTGLVTPPALIDSTVRILGVVASPRDLSPLDVAKEREGVEAAIARTRELGRVELDWLEPATPKRLREALRDGSYHVLHFVGHSDFTADGRGMLYLEDATGAAEPIDETLFANLVADQDLLRLVVLNSCEGARTTATDPYAGVATTLINLGVPAVVAMQFEISDRAAIVFAQELYLNLIGRQDPIDAAIAEARKAIYSEVDPIEWATPVLFVRDPEVELFRFGVPAAPLPPPPGPDTSEDSDDGELPTAAPRSTARQRRRVIGAVAAASVLLVAAAALVARTVSDGRPATTEPLSPYPRSRTDFYAVQVSEAESGDVHLLTVDPATGATGTATDHPGAQDIDPDWDRDTNRLAFRRSQPSPDCTGLCYVVPGNLAGDDGKPVAQLVPFIAGTVPHDPAWAPGSSVFYAVTSGCDPGPGCREDVRRATYSVADDGTGFGDALTIDADVLVAAGLEDIRDLDADPNDETVVAIADGRGIAIPTAETVRRLQTTLDLTAIAFTPDGGFLTALGTAERRSTLAWWDSSDVRVGTVELADVATTFIRNGGDLRGLDTTKAVGVSVTPGREGSFLNVMLDDPTDEAQPVLTAIELTSEGGATITSASPFPLEILQRGTVEAVAR